MPVETALILIKNEDGKFEFDLKGEGYSHSFNTKTRELTLRIFAAGPKNPPEGSAPAGKRKIKIPGTVSKKRSGDEEITTVKYKLKEVSFQYETTEPISQPNEGEYILKFTLPSSAE